MIADEIHANSLRTDSGICFRKISPQILYTFLALRYLVHDVMQRPAVVHVEGRFCQFVRLVLILCESEHIGVRLTQFTHRVVPEICRHFACYVAAESVDADAVHPPVHGFLHLGTHGLAVVVQF